MKKISLLAFVLVALIVTGCKKEMYNNTIIAVAESSEEEGGSKTQLVAESLVAWQTGDKISVRSLTGTTAMATFTYSDGEDFESVAFFETEEIRDKYDATTQFIALFPYSENNDLGSGSEPDVKIDIPSTQEYVDDNTFGTTALPMVAYGGTSDGSLARIQFHHLAGLVRLQLCSTVEKTISTIQFEGKRPISGLFSVNAYNSHDPYLTAVSGNNNMTINVNGKCSLGSTPKTFYVPLPAGDGTVEYEVKMTVTATDGSRLVKSFRVPIDRNSITKMPALNITSWNNDGNGSGIANPTLAGSGTEARPFLIYSVDDLLKVSEAFNSHKAINGKNVWDEKCYFRIMASNIVLDRNNWNTSGIAFNGYLTYVANQNATNTGIENSSELPLFASITAGSTVRGLTVRGSMATTNERNQSYSPFCMENNGTIEECHVSRTASYVMNYSGTQNVGIGGICVTNNGTISGCGCGGTLVAPRVGGICLVNNGTVEYSYAASPMKVATSTASSVYAGGVCYSNTSTGTVRGCYFAADNSNTVNASWGGIVYSNAGTVERCYVGLSGMMQSNSSIGGIVHTMTGGTVDYCWNEAMTMNVLGGTNGMGGIVNTLSGGEVRNCIRYNAAGSFGCTSGPIGGVVATMSGGMIYNSAFYGDMATSHVANKGAFVGDLRSGTIENCYGLQVASMGGATPFWGRKSGGTVRDCYGQVEATDVALYDAESILTNLNGWTPPAANMYRQWMQTGSNPPTLTESSFLSNTTK